MYLKNSLYKFENNGKEKKQTQKETLFARSKLISIVKIIFKWLSDAEISHGEFTLGSNEEENYYKLEDSIRIKNNQRGDIEIDRLIEHSRCITVDEIVRQNKN